MSTGFFGPCEVVGDYVDGGLTSFYQEFTVNNWWIYTDPPETQSVRFEDLARGMWSVTVQCTDPVLIEDVYYAVNSIVFTATPDATSVVYSYPPNELGYWDWNVSDPGATPWPYYGFWGYEWVDGGGFRGTATPRDPLQIGMCVFNKIPTTACATCIPNCVTPAADWTTYGWDQSTSRDLILTVENTGFAAYSPPDEAWYQSFGIPHYTTFEVNGVWGEFPP